MHCLIAYDTDGNVVATLEHLVASDHEGHVLGLVDFGAHELAGGDHTDIWKVASDGCQVKGSKVWPEWLGGRAKDFRVELEGAPGQRRIGALVHKVSGHRRERATIEAAIAATPIVDGARDIRHIVGGPQRPLHIDQHGRTVTRTVVTGTPPHLPLIGR